jgi:hypothetical protein
VPPGRSLVVGGNADLGLLKLTAVRRRGSLRSACKVALLIDLPPQSTTMERVSCTLVVDAQYVERATACARFDLEVASWLLPSRLDLDRLCRLMLVYVAGRPQAEQEGLAVRRVLR